MKTLTCSPASKSVAMTTKEIPSADEDRVIWLKTQRLNGNLTRLLFFILFANDLTLMTELCPTLYILLKFLICILMEFLSFFCINEGGGLSFMSRTFEKNLCFEGKKYKENKSAIAIFSSKVYRSSSAALHGLLMPLFHPWFCNSEPVLKSSAL